MDVRRPISSYGFAQFLRVCCFAASGGSARNAEETRDWPGRGAAAGDHLPPLLTIPPPAPGSEKPSGFHTNGKQDQSRPAIGQFSKQYPAEVRMLPPLESDLTDRIRRVWIYIHTRRFAKVHDDRPLLPITRQF